MRRTVWICDRGSDVIWLAGRLLSHEGWLSTARGLGKQAENIEDQGLPFEIVGLGIACRGINMRGGLGEAVKARPGHMATLLTAREPDIDGVQKRRQRLRISSGQGVAERVQVGGIDSRQAGQEIERLFPKRQRILIEQSQGASH